jgi:hypothetical protein
VPSAAELQGIQKLPVIGLLTQFYLEWQSHFGLRVKPNGTVLDVQHKAMVASLFTIALGVSLKVQRQQPFGFPLLRRDFSLATQLQIMLASEDNGSLWTGMVRSRSRISLSFLPSRTRLYAVRMTTD